METLTAFLQKRNKTSKSFLLRKKNNNDFDYFTITAELRMEKSNSYLKKEALQFLKFRIKDCGFDDTSAKITKVQITKKRIGC